MTLKNEQLFRRLSSLDCEPTSKGREQFFNLQSFGDVPIVPDEYYSALVQGKWDFDFLTSEYQKLYFSGEWWGLLRLWKDWEGERWILKKLLSWHKNLPEWIDKEDEWIDITGKGEEPFW